MKSFIKCVSFSIALVMMLSFSLGFLSAADITNYDGLDYGTYIEEDSGDSIRIESVQSSSAELERNNLPSGTLKFKVYRNSKHEETMLINYSEDISIHIDSNGKKVIEKISSYMTMTEPEAQVTEVSSARETRAARDESISKKVGASASLLWTDYVDNEPFVVNTDYTQPVLPGSPPTNMGYQLMGYRGGYPNGAENTYGYLMRKPWGGLYSTASAHIFTFSAGIPLASAVATIVSYFQSGGIAVLVSIITYLIDCVVQSIWNAYTVKYQIDGFKWLYHIRLNSYNRSLIYNAYRIKYYWESYNVATGARALNYWGASHDQGYLMPNSEMIRVAIFDYLS